MAAKRFDRTYQKIKIGKRENKVQILWDFLSYYQVPKSQPLKFRIGLQFLKDIIRNMNLKPLILPGLCMFFVSNVTSQTSTAAYTPKLFLRLLSSHYQQVGEIPVSTYTGTMDVSVPFYTINTKINFYPGINKLSYGRYPPF
jgi:hypothetical protein